MTGAMGWFSALERHRTGVLLGPRSVLEGDFIGARPGPRTSAGARARTGTHGRSALGKLINVQIPETTLD
ncbi:hypothetical protein GCM10018780_47080 [Streptomyces lanatus]|nr:hypothetical protein GCM10018780_47080 [Streptomyces lanatus]